MVIALNMMDEVTGNQGSIDVNTMEKMLGVPVIPISAAKNEGVDELIKHALHIAQYQEKPLRQDFCDKNDHNGAVHRCIHAVIHLIEDHAEQADIPVRFAATKAIEGDHLILDKLNLDENEMEMLEHIVQQLETERQLDRNASIADMRFEFIEKLWCRYITSQFLYQLMYLFYRLCTSIEYLILTCRLVPSCIHLIMIDVNDILALNQLPNSCLISICHFIK